MATLGQKIKTKIAAKLLAGIPSDGNWARSVVLSAMSGAGVRVDSTTAMSIGAVWRAVNLISSAVGKLPLVLYRRNGDGKDRARDDVRYGLLRYQAAENVDALNFRQTLTAHALLRGNGFAYIDRDETTFRPRGLWPLDPDNTIVKRSKETGSVECKTKIGGQMYVLPDFSFLHIRGLGMDGLMGYSVIRYFADDAGLAKTQRDYASEFFANGAQAGVLLSPKNGTLDAEKIKLLKQSWIEQHAGTGKRHGVAVAPAELSVSNLTISAEDSQLLESRQFSVREIANWFGLPPHKLGDSSRTAYNSLESENQSFLDDCLDAWLCRWELECRAKLLTEEEKRTDSHVVEFMRSALVRADMNARGQFYSKAIGAASWMTVNEIRAAENLNPIEGGDKLIQPLNMAATKPAGEPQQEK